MVSTNDVGWEQAQLLDVAIYKAIDDICLRVSAKGQTLENSAILLALASRLGVSIASVPDRKSRRKTLAEVMNAIETAMRSTTAKKPATGGASA